jgi:nucleoside-diphosphate-sugar epimerase
MNILITGTTSSIATRLIDYLIYTNYKVYCTIRNRNNISIEKKSNIELIEVDLSNENDYSKLPRNIDIIIHLAAVNKFSGHSNLEIIKYNVLINKNIISYAESIKVKKIIYTSSISIYGDVNERIVTNTTLVNSPDCYGISKLVGEVAIKSLGNKISSVSIRLPAILGDKKNQCFITNICKSLSTNLPIIFNNPNTLFNNVINIDSVANFIFKLIINTQWDGHHSFPIATIHPVELSSLILNLKAQLDSKSLINNSIKATNSFIIDSNYAIKNFKYIPDSTIDVCINHCTLFQN